MPEYLIEWTIELDAESPEEAARLALAIQRYPDSLATVFKVYGEDAEGVTIDVTDLGEESEAEDGERNFTNYYKCPRCGHEWTDSWTAMCDDDCPACGLRHISPRVGGRMKFKLEIKCDNEAFAFTTNEEVARILRQVVDQLRVGYTYNGLYDINGNHVGEFKFTGVKT